MKNILEVYLSGNTKELDAALSRADKQLTSYGKKLKDLGQSLSLRLTAPLALAGGAAIKMASDFNESLNKVDVAFKGSSQSVKDFAKNSLKQFGIAQGSALDMAALFGDMATSMGLSTAQAAKMSTSLVALAGDMASFKNMNIEEVTTALNGIFTSETESLKRLGIVMTEANVKTYALSQGIKKQYEEMSQAEKTMLRYQYVMSVTTNSQGDFERTGGGAANQMRVFNESLKELGVLFGQTVLPAFTSIVKSLNGVLAYVKDLSPATKTLIMVFGGFATVLGPLLYLSGTILPNIITGFKIATKAATFFQTTLGKSSLLGVAAIALGYLTEKVYEYNKALGESLELNKEDKKDISIVKERNELIKQRIDLLQQEYKQAGKVKLQTGFDTSKGLPQSKEQIAKRIAELSKLYKQNKAIIGQGNVLATTKEDDASLNVTGETNVDLTPKFDFNDLENKIKDLNKEIFEDFQSINKIITSEMEDVYKKLILGATERGKEFGKALKGWFDLEITGEEFFRTVQKLYGKISEIKSPLQVMDRQIAESTIKQQEQLALMAENYQKFQDNAMIMANAVGNAFANLGMSIVNSFGLAKTGVEGFLASLLSAGVQMASEAIRQSIVNKGKVAGSKAVSTANAVETATEASAAAGPAGIFTLAPFIALAVGAVASAFSGIPAFAKGGIVSGPTMGLMGEYPGAKSNPEVIAPLNKLQNMMDIGGGNNVNVSGEFVVRGQDLILALQRAEKQKQRIG
jgi:hypothetical protein